MYRLCYAEDNVLYFTDIALNSQWGDDWNDAPYGCNAGRPYSVNDDEPTTDGRGHIKCVGFVEGDVYINRAGDYGSFSVEQINRGTVAWLSSDNGSLPAGSSIYSAIRWLHDNDCKCAELK